MCLPISTQQYEGSSVFLFLTGTGFTSRNLINLVFLVKPLPMHRYGHTRTCFFCHPGVTPALLQQCFEVWYLFFLFSLRILFQVTSARRGVDQVEGLKHGNDKRTDRKGEYRDFNGHFSVNPVLVVQINVVQLKALQAVFTSFPHIFGVTPDFYLAIHSGYCELRCQLDFVTRQTLQSLTNMKACTLDVWNI